MSVIYRCDICDNDFDLEAFEHYFGEFVIPASWMPVRVEDSDDSLKIDVCSTDCLLVLAQTLHPESDEPEENEEEPEVGFEQVSYPDVTVR